MKLSDIPNEVWFVEVCKLRGYVGTDAYNECLRIIEKYPEYFVWEHTYSKVPQEVHDAYYLEVHGETKEQFKIRISKELEESFKENNGKSISQQVLEIKPITVNKDSWKDFVNNLKEDLIKEERRYHDKLREESRVKSIWYKHYKKYNLEYREGY